MNTELTELEEWRCVDSLRPDVQVSNLGRIRRYVDMKTTQIVEPRISNGVAVVNLYGKQHSVHRLIASAFIPKPPDCNIVKHRDGNGINNKVDNLEWACSNSGNSSPSTRQQLIYCKELSQLFKTLRTASYITGLPQDLIAQASKDGIQIGGLSFTYVESADSCPGSYIAYVDFDSMYALAKDCQNPEELTQLARQFAEINKAT